MATLHIVVLYALLIMFLSEKIAKRIPDSKTGFLGLVRKFFKFISQHTPNIQ